MKTLKISGSSWIVSIGGFNINSITDIDELLRELDNIVSPNIFQIFDADRIAGWRHIYMAVVNAVSAFDSGSAISRSIAMEIILYVSCQDQISKALEIVGANHNTKRLSLVVLGKSFEETESAFKEAESFLGKPDDLILELDNVKMDIISKSFAVSEIQIETIGGDPKEALTSMLVEKGALITLRR